MGIQINNSNFCNMLKATEYKLEDSNVEGLGGDEDRALKKNAAKGEPAWEGVEALPPGEMKIWRIEKFKVIAWPKEEYGSFYDGDSYIILYAYVPPGTEKKMYNLHFWLGDNTSQDEMGTAAYKTVELDTLLDDLPVQYRETQGNETDLFLGYFPRGLKIMSGGVDSGFRKVKPVEYKPRLLHIKGKRKVRAMQVACSWESLNSGDAFILDAGMKIWVFQGKKAGIFEKNKAAELSRAIDDERGGKPDTQVISEGGQIDKEFWELLGAPASGPEKIKTAEEGGDDNKAAELMGKKLFRISDETGSMKFSEVTLAGGKLMKDMLEPKDCFVVDVGQVFVWIGKGASKAEKAEGLKLAMKYCDDTGKPKSTQIAKVVQGGENSNFLSFFDDR